MTISQLYQDNPHNPQEKYLLGTQLTEEIKQILYLSTYFMEVPESDFIALPLRFFNDYYDTNEDNQIIPESEFETIERYISRHKAANSSKETTLEHPSAEPIYLNDWYPINRIRRNEKIQTGLELLVCGYFFAQDFVNHLNYRPSSFVFPQLDYVCTRLEQNEDEDSLILVQLFRDQVLDFPNPTIKYNKTL